MTIHAAYVGRGAPQVTAGSRLPTVSVGGTALAPRITAPGVPDWVVQRPRIIKLIADGVRWCQLTVVTGPAGAGKTTAVALWAAAQPGSGGEPPEPGEMKREPRWQP